MNYVSAGSGSHAKLSIETYYVYQGTNQRRCHPSLAIASVVFISMDETSRI